VQPPRNPRPLHYRFPPIGGVLARAPVAIPLVLPALHRAAGAGGWFAPVALLAALLDACGIAVPGPLVSIRWLELAVLAALAVANVLRLGDGAQRAWRTPLDGRLAAMLAVLLIASVPRRGEPWSVEGLRVAVTGVGAFYAIHILVARHASARVAAGRTFPMAAVALGLHALWAATSGLSNLASVAAEADARWHSAHGLAAVTLLATVLTLARAMERGAPSAWRLAAVVGVVGTGLHLAALGQPTAGAPLDLRSLVRLEDPLDFSTAMVIALVLHRLGRTAWTLRGGRPVEAGRWWGAIVVIALLATGLVFGLGAPGEGVVLLAAVVAALVSTAHAALSSMAPAIQPAGRVERPERLPRAA
jgi:hypothetical protein